MKKKQRRVVITSLVFLIILLLGFVGASAFFNQIDIHTYEPIGGEAVETVNFEIEPGMLSGDVNARLEAAGLIRSARMANWIVRSNNWGAIQAGEFTLSNQMSLAEMFAVFMEIPVAVEEVHHVIIPEGFRLAFIATRLANELGLDEEALLTLWSDEAFLRQLIDEYWFITEEILNPDLYYPLEGYFYPIRYDFPLGITDLEQITRIMLDMTAARIEEDRAAIEASPFTFHEILTFAAIIEAETQDLNEMPMVSGVFHNRLNIGMLLQTDVTIQYAWDYHTFHVTYAMLAVDSPFNTYRYFGLPPGPVNSPSVHAIRAVMNPASHEYIFFVSDMFGCVGEPGNKNYFTNYDDHRAFVIAYLNPSYQAGRSLCDPNVEVN